MEVYRATLEFIAGLPELADWPEMNSLMQRAAAREAQDWQLPVIACQAVGSDAALALPIVAAIACAQCSIILVDDMLDQDGRGEYRHLGEGNAANLAIAFQAAGLKGLERSAGEDSVKLEMMRSFNQMVLTTALGQYLDTQNPDDEQSYWKLVRTKSSPFFSAAMYGGALVGGATRELAEKFGLLGTLYGEMIQIHDDLGDTMAVPANPDWLQGRSPLPILFAQVVDHPARERFMELRGQTENAEALTEAQSILIRCGAVSYCIDQILERHHQASEMIARLALTDAACIQALFDELILPVQELFASLEAPHPGEGGQIFGGDGFASRK